MYKIKIRYLLKKLFEIKIIEHTIFFKLIFSGLKVKTTKLFQLLAPAQFFRLVRTPIEFVTSKFFIHFVFQNSG